MGNTKVNAISKEITYDDNKSECIKIANEIYSINKENVIGRKIRGKPESKNEYADDIWGIVPVQL
ncbi:hypothetical protein [Erwinia pyrifoliae]|uniref:hypothetical protein n=1 Tax=Erwinia pyrifoliae TaxID=79967 RepID=UPI002203E1B5|nr:hypothetical protein [Erwinia pyrifoliae]MCT2385636.1 hypothetical protein [Erwinia pyrifoliae]MCU8588789.1 hypothetical protein [Erwinia pyrifoliae]UWS29146.1 hypothetical protein NYP81_14685 [Erwinia pyrifoliae]